MTDDISFEDGGELAKLITRGQIAAYVRDHKGSFSGSKQISLNADEVLEAATVNALKGLSWSSILILHAKAMEHVEVPGISSFNCVGRIFDEGYNLSVSLIGDVPSLTFQKPSTIETKPIVLPTVRGIPVLSPKMNLCLH